MTDTKLTRDRIMQLSQKRLALLALELQDALASARDREREPVAIVGLACRFPGGANSPEQYWEMLSEGRDVISEVPADRWSIDDLYDPDPDAPGKMSTRFGGFMDQIDLFDAELFGIAPREAETMDPQQRLLLEVSWEALERAGIAPDSLKGTRAGVFVGVCNNDYGRLVLRRDSTTMDAYVASGTAFSVVAGRVAYALGLEGAAFVVDTACSSSLVAINEACQHLRSRSVSLALAGGVNVICSPDTTIALSKAHMMAPDGRCKTFDDSADGFVRGEGCGVLVLKRLRDAVTAGDRIIALIRGTAVNQDGRSSGLTVPNGSAQASVIRDALAVSGLAPDEVDYIEAHGTGTSLGDPIEIRALGDALCRSRSADRPLYVGSVKTNIGHLESAAGVAGVIKAALAIQQGRIPPHLHFSKPNHDVAWEQLPIHIPTELAAWPRGAESRVAGVSSFGFSGTNAHVILSAPPPEQRHAAAETRPLHVLPLSAKTPGALASLVERYRAQLGSGVEALDDFCHTAAAGRAHLRERTAVVGGTAAALAAALGGISRIEAKPAARRPVADIEPVFMFTGSGAQWPTMGRALYAASPAFRKGLDACAEILNSIIDQPLSAILNCSEDDADRLLNRTRYLHPALFAFEYALAGLWQSWGIQPAAVIGHSVGEYVAACVAGVFSLEDALKLVAERARLIDELPPGGGMAAVFASVAEVGGMLRALDSDLDIAAINGPANVVVSGSLKRIAELTRALGERGVESRGLIVSHAFHSVHLEPMLDRLEAYAAGIEMRAPAIPLVSNLSGKPFAADEAPSAAYWKRHAREAVQFQAGVENLSRSGYRWFIEIGPHPTLLAMAQQCAPGDDLLTVPSLRRGSDEWQQMLEGLATLYVHGAQIDWAELDRPYGYRSTAAPTYAFDRKRFWVESSPPGPEPAIDVDSNRAGPLVGRRLGVPTPTFLGVFSGESDSYLYAHRLAGSAMVSAPLFAEIAIEAAAAVRGRPQTVLTDLSIDVPLTLVDHERTAIHTVVAERDDGSLAVQIATKASSGSGRDWIVHARAVCPVEPAVAGSAAVGPVAADRLDGVSFVQGSAADFYAALRELNIDLGPAVAGIREIWYGASGAEVVARLVLAEQALDGNVYRLHPATADAALQALGAAIVSAPDNSGQAYLLAGIGCFELHEPVGPDVWCRAVLRACAAEDEVVGDVVIYDASGTVLATLAGVALRRVNALRAAAVPMDRWGYRVEWPIKDAAAPALGFGTARELAPTDVVGAAADAAFAEASAEFGLSVYDDALPAMDMLACRYIVDAFLALGFGGADVLDPDSLVADGRIVPQHRRLLSRLFDILEEGGFVSRTARGFTWRSRDAAHPSAADLIERFPLCGAELALLERCGTKLASVLCGELDPVALLFSEGLSESLRHLYRATPFALTANRVLVTALRQALDAVPPARPIRIVEVGAGTGGTTAFILPMLQGRRVEYVFTDVSPAFLESASVEFAEYPFIFYELFDVERDPATQELAAGSFDIAIAANAVHATRDLSAAIRHMKQLLAPGGLVFLMEGTTREPWVDLTFGLTDGWWRFEDLALRPSYPLLDRAAWRGALESQGLSDVQIVPAAAPGSERARSQAVLIARAGDPVSAPHALNRTDAGQPRRWIVVGTETPVGAALLQAVDGIGLPLHANGTAAQAARWDALLETLEREPDAAVEVVYAGALAADGPGPCAQSALTLMQAVSRAGTDRCRLWVLTAGAVPAAEADERLNVAQAPVWGLGRVYALECSDTWGGLIDVDPDTAPADCAWQVVEQIVGGGGEDQVAYRAGRRHVARLVPAPLPSYRPLQLAADGSYLITGGLGGIGLALAARLAVRGARQLVLTSRSAQPAERLDDERRRSIEAIEACGATVRTAAVDVTDRLAMRALIDGMAAEGMPLRGVFHAAADVGSATLDRMTPDQLEGVLSAKVDGTAVLHELTREMPLDMFVMFSSTTALLGAAGLAHYAAANQFMDVLALDRRAQGLPALAINWGTWEIMRVATAEEREAFLRGGLRPMATAAALDAMECLITGGAVHHAVADIDWDRLKTLYEAKRSRPLLERLGGKPQAGAAVGGASASGGVLDELRTMSSGARREALVSHLQAAVGSVLRVDAARLSDLREGFFDLGMDSLMAVELKTRLEKVLGHPLPSTLAFNYPNIDAVAGYVEAELLASAAPEEAEQPGAADAEPAVPAEELDESALEERLADKLRGLGFE